MFSRIFGKNDEGREMKGTVEEIFTTSEGSKDMESVEEIRTIRDRGIEGDRYCEGTGFWTQYGDVCQITLISGEDLDHIETELGLNIKKGEHRRNIITRGIDLGNLRRKRFRVGEALLEYDRPRPPCKHVQDITEAGMTRALRNRGGICARVVEAGKIKPGDAIEAE
ncbi:MAG: MOSC domain-containing protein [Actinomycetota bacterium]|jgi:MOSC domain-containing protein YiiM|nr:MOSC domain-containing protein [Actinomycetota bacterium]